MNTVKSSTSSRRGSQRGAKKGYITRPFNPAEPVTDKQRKNLYAAMKRGVKAEDLDEIPELNLDSVRRIFDPGFSVEAVRPEAKRQLTVRLDADIFRWLRSFGNGYQTRLNAFLREVMVESRSRQR